MIKRFFVFCVALTAAGSAANCCGQEKVNDRLDVGSQATSDTSKIELEGTVSQVNKYSIAIVNQDQTWHVKVDQNTDFVLKCSSPRIDFEESVTWVAIEGADKKYKSYKFKSPLYVQAEFNHKHQFERIMSGVVKRFPTYAIANNPFVGKPQKRQILLAGKVVKGAQGRQLKMTTTSGDVHQVLLSKNGRWHGFSLADLQAGSTKVRINGLVNQKKQVKANTILFWPVKKSDQTDGEKPQTDESSK